MMSNKNDRKMSGNKGEWSELYAFMKLLSQGRVYAANERVEKIKEVFYPILKIMREEQKGTVIDYVIDENEVKIKLQAKTIKTISRQDLDNQANKLLEEIAAHSSSFELEDIAKFANGIEITKIKAPSTDKTDISMQIEDTHTNYIRNVGFSIKSELGKAPTLLNAGRTTNFIYKITGITSKQAEEINRIDTDEKIKDRIKAINDMGGKLEYFDMNHKGFKRNLGMLDTSMPQMLGAIISYYYGESINKCTDLIKLVAERNPLNYEDSMFYEYKFKKLLCACALGMKPAKVWDGLEEANGGYIIVKADGELLAYHIYNRNCFEQYLLDNTAFDRGGTSKHKYMNIYEENGDMFIQLNLQIRFK